MTSPQQVGFVANSAEVSRCSNTGTGTPSTAQQDTQKGVSPLSSKSDTRNITGTVRNTLLRSGTIATNANGVSTSKWNSSSSGASNSAQDTTKSSSSGTGLNSGNSSTNVNLNTTTSTNGGLNTFSTRKSNLQYHQQTLPTH
uniref:Uncharacterized protein n=1 Tax=Lygus hesperus TaxID=30085 RepID=A0A0A9Z0K6_LYGHE